MGGFLLGLANGGACLGYCVPVLVPFLLGEGRKTRQNWKVLGQFFCGRLGGYFLFALIAWAIGKLVAGGAGTLAGSPGLPLVGLASGAAYLGLAGLMLWYGLGQAPAACPANLKGLRARLQRWPAALPAALGVFTGLNLCPPFIAALAQASVAPTLFDSLVFFLAFFAGTSLYLLPVSFLGSLNRVMPLRTIGKMAAVLVAAYYIYTGMMYLLGGIYQL